VTIEQLLTEQNDYLRRIAEGVEHLVVLGEKQAGVLPEAPADGQPMAVPLSRQPGAKMHAVFTRFKQYEEALRLKPAVCCRAESSTRNRKPQTDLQMPARSVSLERRCRHDACWKVFAEADAAT
jgi:hypothetical protein